MSDLTELTDLTDSSSPDETVLAAFLRHAAEHPQAPAVEDEDGGLSYAELLAVARARAARLVDMGARRGSRVAIECPRRTDHLVALLGTWLLAAVAVPLDSEAPAERRRYQIRTAGCAAAVTGPDADGVVARAVSEVAAGSGGQKGDADGSAAYVLFTSGSTGVPKGVEIGHPALSNTVRALADVLGLGRGHRTFSLCSLVFDVSLTEMLLPLATGGTVVMAPQGTGRNPEKLAGFLRAAPVDAALATPTQLRLLLPFIRGERAFGDLLAIGEALTAALAGDLLTCTDRLWNAYGPTEAAVIALIAEVAPPFADPMPIGVPLVGTDADVLDERLRPVPTGAVGELCLSGAGLAAGYAAEPELTARAFVAGPDGERVYRTGDLVHRGSDGRFYYHGRRDDQVKIRGHRVELGELEVTAQGLPFVTQAVAVTTDALRAQPELYLAIVTAGHDSTDAVSQVRARLRQRLPSYMQPRRVLVFPELPVSSAGKISRQAARELVDARLVGS